MKCIVARGGGAAADPSTFFQQDRPIPEPQGRDILVRLAAIGMNPVDTKIRMRAQGEVVLGWDACGTVEAIGSDVTGFSRGDRVYYAGDVTRPGTNSECHLVDERIAAIAPASLDDADAAAMPLTSITAWEALFERLQFTPEAGANAGRSVMIIGGAGGVGSIATQLARWSGLTVYATASRRETAEWCAGLGATAVLNHSCDLAAELDAAGAAQVDAIFCTTHMEKHWQAMAECIRPQGRIVLIDDPQNAVDITVFKHKCVSLAWEFMFTRSMFQTDDMAEQGRLLARVAGLLDGGAIRPTRSETLFGLSPENIRAMHVRQESGAMAGKQVLVLGTGV
jgi:zinc-binding alcohol dehydrogenase family protein